MTDLILMDKVNIMVGDFKKESDKFVEEINLEMVGNWRPKDAFRLRLRDTIKPKDFTKLSDDDMVEGIDFFSNATTKLYSMCRYLKPNIIIETGVQNGLSTELILGALKINNNGKLYSVDTGNSGPSSERTWDGIPGKYIKQELRDNWNLRIGLTRDELPKIIDELKKEGKTIDIFHHDSDHSTGNIEFELEQILPQMSIGGIICMHDREDREFNALKHLKRKTIHKLDFWIVE